MEPVVHSIHEPGSGTWQQIVADPQTKRAAIIDSVLNFDPAKNEISTASADELLGVVQTEGYSVDFILETHLHADHLSAASYLRRQLETLQGTAPRIGIGNGIAAMQKLFAQRFGVPEDEWANAFDNTFSEGEEFSLGSLQVKVMHLPGHTPDHIGYVIGSNVFAGDSVFNPDLGSARCDFPQGSATALWNSTQKLLSLPADFKLFTGHDYPPSDRDGSEGTGRPKAYATVQEHKQLNKHVKDGTLEASFVEMRTTRDAGLSEPKLINQALQVNIRAGRMPKRSPGGDCLIHVPLKVPSVMVAA